MDLPGEKLLIKMWETLVERGIGRLLTPWQTIREGKAMNEVRRQELLTLAQAEAEASDIRAGRKRLLKDGTLQLIGAGNEDSDNRCTHLIAEAEKKNDLQSIEKVSLSTAASMAVRSEINASKAVVYAEERLANDAQEPPDRSIDDDWLFTWREYAGNVSTEELQQLWGNILAGEVKSPGTYSLRTLEFLRGLSKSEAELITELAQFSIESTIVLSQNTYLEEQGIPFVALMQLQEIGILSGVDASLSITYKSASRDKFMCALRSNGKVLVVEHEDPTKELKLKVCKFTGVGAQIMSLGSFNSDLQYLRLIGKQIASQGFKVRLADWVRVSDDQIRFFNEESIES
jgi:hypothetical protein